MKLNIVAVYNQNATRVLMCYRAKEPYKNTYNFVGGKVEDNEDGLTAAYRELLEETGITKDDISLVHFMDFNYHISGIELNLYVGKLKQEVELREEVNSLCWIDVDENFFDMTRFAGHGNIGHMVEFIKLHKDKVFGTGLNEK